MTDEPDDYDIPLEGYEAALGSDLSVLQARIEELEERLNAAQDDAKEAEAYAEEIYAHAKKLEAKLAAAKQEGFEGGMITAMKVVSSIGYGENHDVDKGYEEAFSAIEKYYADWKAAAPPSQNWKDINDE